MRVYSADGWETLMDAPIGLVEMANGKLVMKTEYYDDNDPICYVVESGERYSSGYDKKCRSVIIK